MTPRDDSGLVDSRVRVPAGVRFVGRTVNGGIDAANLGGDVEASTVNGSIHVSTSGYAEATTVDGSIVASVGRAAWADALELRTVNRGAPLRPPAHVHDGGRG